MMSVLNWSSSPWILITFFFICITAVSGQKCPLYWEQRGSICYRYRYRNLMSWNDAENYCKQQQAHLVKFENTNERNWMMTRIGKIITQVHQPRLRFWTGLSNYNTSSYTWADGSSVDPRITQGQKIYPSTSNHCVKVEGNQLMNVNCNTKYGYICERHIGIPLTCNRDSGWQSFSGYCYKVYYDTRAVNTWAGAQKICDQQGGNLFTVQKPGEEQIIHDFSKNTQKNYWIGVKAYQQGSSYAWLTVPNNTVLDPSLSYWARKPTVQRAQYNKTCAVVLYSRNSPSIAWQAIPCTRRMNFVCKKAEGSCQPGWVAHQNRCYQFNTKFLLSWQQSKAFCQRQGARMVESYGTTATNFLNSYLDELRSAGINSFWIGATDNNSTTYKWSIGAAIKYQHWVHNPPSNTANRQDCVFINTYDRRGLWRPTRACGVKKAFICTIDFGRQPKPMRATPRPSLRCDAHWILKSGNCYQFNDTRRNWEGAQAICQRQGGQLATVSSNDIHTFIISRIRTAEYWIGLNDRTQNRKFVWSADGSALKRPTKWCPHEPNDQGTENCIEYKNRCWNDKACTTGLKFVCQKPPKSVPTGAPMTTTPRPFSLRCGVGWEEDPSSHYCYQFHDDQLAWMDARLACRRMGGDLASVHNREEQVYINTRSATMNSVALWLGGTDRSREGGWTWSDGTPFNYVNWQPGEPNDYRHREDCMGYYVGRAYTWNDFPCNNRNGFICKKHWGPQTTVPPRVTPQKPSGMFYGCPTYWKKFGDSCWVFYRKNFTATAARSQCQRMGGYLATVNSRSEQNFINANLPRPIKGPYNGGSYWIGLSDRVSENSFVWDEGRPVLFTNWNQNEPNNYRKRNEDCVGIWLKTRGWNDANCDTAAQGFVCRKGLQVVASTGQDPLLQGCRNPSRGIGFQGYCYAIIDTQYSNTPAQTWQNAQNMCQSRYKGQLATVNSRYVQAFLASYINHRKDYFWIGLSDKQTPGTYSWASGQADYYTNWYFTHSGNENHTCVAMRTSHPIGLWENQPCTSTHNFICESARTGFTNPPSTIPPNVPCPTGWNQYLSYCYKKYSSSSQKLTWEQSRDFCRGIGGDLLSIHDNNELNYVKTTLLTDDTNYWIGLNDRVNETGYVWSDQNGLDFTAWAPNEPNNYNNEDCVQIIGNPSIKGKWNDNNCFLSLPYICKIQRGTALITTPAPVTGQATTQCGVGNWILYNNACYLISPTYGANSSLSWYQAQQYCITNGANLASIHSRDENNLLLSMVSKLNRNEFWIGLNELQKPGKYKWTDGSVLDFTSWNGNEPNDAFGGERCGGILSFNGNWNDDNCNEALGFICKKIIGSAGPVTPQPPQLISGGCAVAGFSPDPYGNKCFFASNSTNPMDWQSARKYCTNFGTGYDIAAINNEMEQAFTASLIAGFSSDVWIGLNNVRHHSRFVWQDNSPFLYTNWNTGEPNGRSQQGGGSTEDCVEMYAKGIATGAWNDLRCNTPRNVICQGPKSQGKQTPSPQGNCKPGYVSHGTSCYKFVKTPGQNWQMANNLCQGDGGTLVIVNSNAENYFVESQMGPNFDYWIGLQYNMYSKAFAWPQSWPVLFTRWGSAEPSTGPNDMCVKMTNGNWDNTQCTLALGYVCEINSVQPPPVTPAPLGHCRNPDEVINGDYCYFFSPFNYQSWPMARFNCNKRQMDLVSITSDEERLWVWSVMMNSRDSSGQRTAQNIWIGLTKGINSGFLWSDTTAFSYTYWNQGEPSDPINATNEECVEMYRDSSKWNDIPCTQTKSYVCKGRAVLGAAQITQAPTQGPPTQGPGNPTVPTNPTQGPVNPNTLKPATTKRITVKPVTPYPGRQTIPTLPNINPVTNKPPQVVTVPRANGALNGPNAPQARTRVVNNKNSLSGGALVGVLITVVAVIGVLGMIGILYWKKRNPSPSLGGGGFDNALYSKGNERVNIDNTATDG